MVLNTIGGYAIKQRVHEDVMPEDVMPEDVVPEDVMPEDVVPEEEYVTAHITNGMQRILGY